MKDQLFQQKIQPAAWVMPRQAEMAMYIYEKSLKGYREQNSGNKNFPKDIVPYEIRMQGIKQFVTDPAFKKFWEKNGEYGIINVIGGLYMKYFGSDEEGYFPSQPCITLTQRNKELTRGAKKLEDLIKIINLDISIWSRCAR